MSSPTLFPPRGVFIPTQMIFHPHLPPSILLTWIQLRILAWGGQVTLPLSMQVLCRLTKKRQKTLYKHMTFLKRSNVLSWCSNEQGKIILSFPDPLSDKPEQKPRMADFPDSMINVPVNIEIVDPFPYFPNKILGYLSYQDDRVAG